MWHPQTHTHKVFGFYEFLQCVCVSAVSRNSAVATQFVLILIARSTTSRWHGTHNGVIYDQRAHWIGSGATHCGLVRVPLWCCWGGNPIRCRSANEADSALGTDVKRARSRTGRECELTGLGHGAVCVATWMAFIKYLWIFFYYGTQTERDLEGMQILAIFSYTRPILLHT